MTEAVLTQPRDWNLSDSAPLRFIVVGFMYFSQGLPLGLFGVAIPTYLAELGIFNKAEIAQFLVIIGLPWAFKFLAGPLMDRISFLIYGHRRPWVVIAQSGLMVTFVVSAALAGPGEPNLFLLAACGFVLNIFASTQDVAVDGLAIGVLKEKERAKATAVMFGGQKIGNLAGAVGGGLLLSGVGVGGACVIAAITTFMLMLLPLTIKERRIEKRFPWSIGQIAPEVLELKVECLGPMLWDLMKALFVPISVFFLLASFCDSAAGGLLGAYLIGFTVIDLNWADDAYNALYSTANLIGAGVGLLLSPLFDIFGQRKCIVALCLVTVLGILAFVFFPVLQEGWGWHIFIVGFWISQHLFAVLIISACMQLVTPRIAASQFAIYMSIANLSSTVGSSFIGLFGEVLSFEVILLIAAFLVAIAPILFWMTKLGVRGSDDVSSAEKLANSQN